MYPNFSILEEGECLLSFPLELHLFPKELFYFPKLLHDFILTVSFHPLIPEIRKLGILRMDLALWKPSFQKT